MRIHRKVWIWWNRWAACQFVNQLEWSFGVRIEWRRPLLDVFLGPFTFSLGRHPALTDPRIRYRHGSRGYFHGRYPDDCVL